MVWKIIRRRPRIENAHLQKSPRVEISMRFFRRHRSDARQKKLATMSPIGTESAKNLFCAHLGVSQNRLWRSWETRVCSRFHRAIFPLTFVLWFDPLKGRIFVVFLSNYFWQICRSAALEIVLIIFDKFAVFGRSKNGVSSFSWYLRRTVNKEKTALTRAVIMFIAIFFLKKSRKKSSKKARLLLWWNCREIIT